MRIKNKKVHKLRTYRDKLLAKQAALESVIRSNTEVFKQIVQAVTTQPVRTNATQLLRVVALASDRDRCEEMQEFRSQDEIIKELTLVYRFLVVERKYTEQVQAAAMARDYLRVAALSADHQAESIAHDKMLDLWSKDHGFTRRLRMESKDEDII